MTEQKIAKLVRVITTAPLMAGVMLLVLAVMRRDIFHNGAEIFSCFLFLTVLPLLGYPLQRFIPLYRDRGRDGQRNLAMLFAVIGYICGCAACLFFRSSASLWLIYFTYLCSGAAVSIFNKLLHLRASGHACGVSGPAALLISLGIPAWWPGLVVLALMYWASIVMGRHDWRQLVGGTIIPILFVIVGRIIFA